MNNGANIRRLTSERTVAKSRSINGYLERLARNQISLAQFIDRTKNCIARFSNESLAITAPSEGDQIYENGNISLKYKNYL